MKKKSILLVALSVMLVAAVATAITLAYFTDEKTAKNTFTVGNVSIELTEPNWAVSPEEGSKVYPGEPLPKDPQVTNNGSNPCFVRIAVDMPTLPDGQGEVKFRTKYVVDALGANWVDGKDGYYYYRKLLDVTETTTPLFDSILIPVELENETDFDAVYNVIVYAEAVQAQGIFPSFSTITDGISDAEWDDIVVFFKTAFPTNP